MTTFTSFLIKSTFYSTLIIGVGYGLMINIVPTEEQLRKTIEENDKLKGEINAKIDRDLNRKMIRDIIENSKKDRPIWKVGPD